MSGSAAIKAGEAFISIFTDWSRMKSGLNSAGKFGTEWGAKISATGTAATAGLGGLALLYANAGSEIADMSARTGASTGALQELGFAAAQTGSDMKGVEAGIKKFNVNLSDAAAGEESATKAFDKWGLSAKDFIGLDTVGQFKLLADRMKDLSAEDKTNMMMELLGKSGTALIPILGGGAEALGEMIGRFHELGLGMSESAIAKADELGDRFDEVTSVAMSVAYTLGEQLQPVLMGMSEIFFDVAGTVREFVAENPKLVSGLMVASGAAAVVGVAMIGLGTAVTFATGAVGTLIGVVTSPIGIGVGILAVGALIEYETGIGAMAIDYLAESMRNLGGIGAMIPDVISAGFGRISADASMLADASVTAFGGIVDAVSAGDLGLAGEIAMAGLNLAFVTGWTELKDLWTVSTAWLEMRWADVTFGMASGWENMSTIIGNVWNGAMSMIDGAMTEISLFIVDVQQAAGLLSKSEGSEQRGTIRDMRDRRNEQRDGQSGQWNDAAEQAKAERIAEIEKARDEALAGRQGDVAAARSALEAKAAQAAQKVADKIGDKNAAVQQVIDEENDGPKKKDGKDPKAGDQGAGDVTVSGLASSMTRAFSWMGETKPPPVPKPGESMLPLGANDPKNAASQNAKEMEKLRQYEQGLSGLSGPSAVSAEAPTADMNAELLAEIRDVLHSIDGRVASGSTMEA